MHLTLIYWDLGHILLLGFAFSFPSHSSASCFLSSVELLGRFTASMWPSCSHRPGAGASVPGVGCCSVPRKLAARTPRLWVSCTVSVSESASHLRPVSSPLHYLSVSARSHYTQMTLRAARKLLRYLVVLGTCSSGRTPRMVAYLQPLCLHSCRAAWLDAAFQAPFPSLE